MTRDLLGTDDKTYSALSTKAGGIVGHLKGDLYWPNPARKANPSYLVLSLLSTTSAFFLSPSNSHFFSHNHPSAPCLLALPFPMTKKYPGNTGQGLYHAVFKHNGIQLRTIHENPKIRSCWRGDIILKTQWRMGWSLATTIKPLHSWRASASKASHFYHRSWWHLSLSLAYWPTFLQEELVSNSNCNFVKTRHFQIGDFPDVEEIIV